MASNESQQTDSCGIPHPPGPKTQMVRKTMRLSPRKVRRLPPPLKLNLETGAVTPASGASSVKIKSLVTSPTSSSYIKEGSYVTQGELDALVSPARNQANKYARDLALSNKKLRSEAIVPTLSEVWGIPRHHIIEYIRLSVLPSSWSL